MMVEVMAKVERHYSRKVGDSFRRDKEHLALFEELGLHEDLDSSLGNSFLSLCSASDTHQNIS